jgi:NitT/TauT family transport system substrate-binding protein
MTLRPALMPRLMVATILMALLATPVSEWNAVARADAGAPILRVGYAPWVGPAPLLLARDKRFFANDQKVRFEEIKDTKLRFGALASGKLDGVVTTVDTMTYYWKRSSPFRAVLGLDDSNGGDGLVAASGIAKIEDLRGKRVAVPFGSVAEFFLNTVLRDHDMTESDLRLVDMQQDDAGKAVLTGQVDAAVTWEPWLSRAKASAGKRVLIDTRETPGLIADVLVFRQDVIRTQSESIKTIVTGWYEAVEYWKRRPDEAEAEMARAVGDWLSDVSVFKYALNTARYYDQAINKDYMAPGGRVYETAQKAIDILTSLHRITGQLSATDLIDSEFVMGP